jgi:hypothetical protein
MYVLDSSIGSCLQLSSTLPNQQCVELLVNVSKMFN